MLSKNDLQAIDKVVAKRIGSDVPAVIQQVVPPIIDNVVGKKLRPIIKKLNDMDKFLDKQVAHAQRRVKVIEQHLDLPVPSAL